MSLQRVIFFGACVLSLTAGCGSTKPEEPKELTDPSQKDAIQVSLDTPEQTLLDTAKNYFDRELYSLAKQNFEALRAGYPNSHWAEFAEIKIADCLFESGEYPDAAKAYEAYVSNRPTAEGAPYMLYRAARSNQLSHHGVGRDPAPMQKALDQYNQLISTYPDSPYSESAKKNRQEAVDILVAHENRVKHFYEKQNREEAVAARDKMINEQWVPVVQQTRYSAQKGEGEIPEGEALSEIPPPSKEISKSVRASVKYPVETITSSGRMLKIECRNDEARGVFIYFDKQLPLLEAYKNSQRILLKDGVLTLSLHGVTTPEQSSDCFAKNDLSLNKDGAIIVKSEKDGMAMSLENPPRLFISIPK